MTEVLFKRASALKANNSNFVMVKCGVFFEVLFRQGSASEG
jgi:hypothetical protein